jgi:hypothetical protein
MTGSFSLLGLDNRFAISSHFMGIPGLRNPSVQGQDPAEAGCPRGLFFGYLFMILIFMGFQFPGVPIHRLFEPPNCLAQAASHFRKALGAEYEKDDYEDDHQFL